MRPFLLAAFCLGAWSTLSCSAVLGLDEPTHRSSGIVESGGGGGSGNGSGGASNGASGGDGGTDSTTGGGSNQGGMGGASGPGGSPAGGAGGSAGAVGTPDGGSAGGNAGGGAGAKDAGAPKANCATLPLCDDFEATQAETLPNPTKWIYDPTQQPNAVLVDGVRFPGQKTVRIEGIANPQLSSAFKNKTSLNIGQVWFIRMRVIIPTSLGNGSGGFMAIVDEVTGRRLWLGVTGQYLAYSSIQGGGGTTRVLPSQDPTQAALGFKVPDTWMCIEVKYDAENAQVQTWVNGTDIAALRADGVATPGVDDVWMNTPPFKPQLTSIMFGWWDFFGPAAELWMDDVAVAATRIGCN